MAFGVRRPPDNRHRKKYPYAPVAPGSPPPGSVEKFLTLSASARTFYDQGKRRSCVGFSLSEMATILNSPLRYSGKWLWDRAKERDEFPDSAPGVDTGTSLRAGLAALIELGHARVKRGQVQPPKLIHGISTYRWGSPDGPTAVQEVRTAIASGVPVVIATAWCAGMSDPVKRGKEFWVPNDLGAWVDSHAYLLEAWSDSRDAARTPNTWGTDYPRTWISRALLEWLLTPSPDRWSEMAVVTDR